MITHPTLEHHTIHINGIRMHYVQAGSGKTLVVMLHGFPEFWYSWRHQIPALSEQFTVVAPDLRGYNETEKPNWGYELDVLVNDVVSLIRELGHTSAVVIGHDWGGVIAWALAIAYPQWVQRLVVLNAPHPARLAEAIGRNWAQMARSWYVGFFQLPFLPETLIRANDYAAIEAMIRGTMIDKSHITDEDVRMYKEAIAKPGALTAALNYYRAYAQRHTPDLLNGTGLYTNTGMRVAAPTLLIWGEQDPALGKELTEGTERFVPDLRIRYIAESSHWVQQEQPELVNQYILEFLAALA